jgi:glycosyltransferase involved in cell wall biosynthesis
MEAARRLKGRAVFRLVGEVGLTPRAAARMAEDVDLRGAVPRSEVRQHYAWADVFLLPSLCEGSATVTYEALACGLPVVCTDHTGSVVQDGQEGFVVPARDVEAITGRLARLAGDPALLEQMGRQARLRAAEYTVAAHVKRLLGALEAALSTG